jgi:hypothetical protein
MKVDILGTKYRIYTSNADKEPALRGLGGFEDNTTKEICIDESYVTEKGLPANSLKDMSVQYRHILRHEIIHAFLDESGLEIESRNELLVDWIATQFPKMQKVFEKVGVDK